MFNQKTRALPPSLAKALSELATHPYTYLSSYELIDKGIYNTANVISALKRRGAIIDVIRKDAIDLNGEAHSRVAHYQFKGWYND